MSENKYSLISIALEIVVTGGQDPQISCRADAEAVVKASKFSPIGERGVCRFVRAADYSSKERNSYFESANDKTMIIIHIEGIEGVENIDDILEVEEIDVVFIGPYDLSQSVGLSGQVDHPHVEELMKSVVNKALKKGKSVGTFVDNDIAAKKWRAHGVKYISYSVDMGMIYDKFKEVVDQFND